jgi:hypothetical protein
MWSSSPTPTNRNSRNSSLSAAPRENPRFRIAEDHGVSKFHNDNTEEGRDNEEKRSNAVALSVETREQIKQQMFEHLDELCCRLMKEGLTEKQAKSELAAIATEALREVRTNKAA